MKSSNTELFNTYRSCLVVSSFQPVCNDALCATVAIETRRVTQSDERPSPHDSAPKLALCVSVALDAGCHFHTDWMASRDVASKSIISDGRGLVLSTLSLSGGDLPACGDVTGSPFPIPQMQKVTRDVPVGALGGPEAGTTTSEAHRPRAGWGWRQMGRKQPEP